MNLRYWLGKWLAKWLGLVHGEEMEEWQRRVQDYGREANQTAYKLDVVESQVIGARGRLKVLEDGKEG